MKTATFSFVSALSSFVLVTALAATERDVSLGQILAPMPAREMVPVVAEEPKGSPEASDAGEEEPSLISIQLPEVILALEEVVRAQSTHDGSLRLHSSAPWEAIEVPADSHWEIVLKNGFNPDLRGRWYAAVDILLNGETIASRHLRVEASSLQEVYMVTRKVNRGDRINASNVSVVSRDIFLERGSPILATEELFDIESTRSLGEGRLLTWDDVRECPAVRRGDIVEVRVENGALRVTVQGRVLEDGRMGQQVLVRNTSSQRELFAEVVGRDAVLFRP